MHARTHHARTHHRQGQANTRHQVRANSIGPCACLQRASRPGVSSVVAGDRCICAAGVCDDALLLVVVVHQEAARSRQAGGQQGARRPAELPHVAVQGTRATHLRV